MNAEITARSLTDRNVPFNRIMERAESISRK